MASPEFKYGQIKAHAAVCKAVKNGDLQPVKSLNCVDCEKPANIYEHRDYNKPLEVVPCCYSCNAKRGGAIPLALDGTEKLPDVVHQLTVPLKFNQIEALKKATILDHRTISSYVRVSLAKGLSAELQCLFNKEG